MPKSARLPKVRLGSMLLKKSLALMASLRSRVGWAGRFMHLLLSASGNSRGVEAMSTRRAHATHLTVDSGGHIRVSSSNQMRSGETTVHEVFACQGNLLGMARKRGSSGERQIKKPIAYFPCQLTVGRPCERGGLALATVECQRTSHKSVLRSERR